MQSQRELITSIGKGNKSVRLNLKTHRPQIIQTNTTAETIQYTMENFGMKEPLAFSSVQYWYGYLLQCGMLLQYTAPFITEFLILKSLRKSAMKTNGKNFRCFSGHSSPWNLRKLDHTIQSSKCVFFVYLQSEHFSFWPVFSFQHLWLTSTSLYQPF